MRTLPSDQRNVPGTDDTPRPPTLRLTPKGHHHPGPQGLMDGNRSAEAVLHDINKFFAEDMERRWQILKGEGLTLPFLSGTTFPLLPTELMMGGSNLVTPISMMLFVLLVLALCMGARSCCSMISTGFHLMRITSREACAHCKWRISLSLPRPRYRNHEKKTT